MGSAEAESWRRCRSNRVEELAEAVPGCVRAGRPRSQVGILSSLLPIKGARAALPGRSPADAAQPSRLVALRGPSCVFVDNSSFFVSGEHNHVIRRLPVPETLG